MFKMKDYPRDILPLYSQGYSLARFFIQQGGKRKFVEYVGEGMRMNNWTATTKKYYGFNSLSDLQLTWLEWVREGSRSFPDGQLPETLLVLAQPSRNEAATARANVGQTQMASLAEPAQSRAAQGTLASWQSIPSQNSRAFEQGREYVTPLAQPASLARPAVVPVEPSAEERNTASRPYSEGWYARQRDQMQAARKSNADMPAQSAAASAPEPELKGAGAETSTAKGVTTQRQGIWAVPASSVSPTSGDRRVLMEWTRPQDRPYRSSAELTGVAMREVGTVLR
jgi:hypothetical protein